MQHRSYSRARRFLWLTAALVLAGLALGLAGRLLWPAGELAAAEQALARHDPHAAKAHADRYLAARPGHGPALLLGARAARRADACADAERLLAEHEAAEGPTDAARWEWALLGVQQGDFGDEERVVAVASRPGPDAVDALEALAKGYAAAVRGTEEAAVLDRLLTLAPGHVPALVLRAASHERLRRPHAAEDDLRKAVSLQDQPRAQAALAGLLARRGYCREAIARYELALGSLPTDAAVLLGLARAHADAAEPDRAADRLDQLLLAHPNDPDGLVERARVEVRRRRSAEAEPFLAHAVRVAPWHGDAWRLSRLAADDLGRTADVARCDAKLAELRAEDAEAGRLKLRARDNPGDAAVRWELVQWSRRNGQTAEGLAWLTEVLRITPADARARAALADYFEQAGQPRRAAQYRTAAR